jgi:hypothetical protein
MMAKETKTSKQHLSRVAIVLVGIVVALLIIAFQIISY